MEERVLSSIVSTSKRLMKWASRFPRRRFLYDELKGIDEEYYVGIKGIRGVGKTVLLLQLAFETEKSVYFSADSTLLKPYSLYEVVNELAGMGFRNVFIDEIHRKAGWEEDLKTLYDEHGVRVFFSGSSAVDIVHSSADLSRRVVLKELPPASFREWLNVKRGTDLPRLSLDEILSNTFEATELYMEYASAWREYMLRGGVLYPEGGFFDALENSIRKVILEDMASMREVNVKYEEDAFRLLYLIAKSKPFEVNYSKIARNLGVSKTLAVRLVSDLEKAGLVIRVLPCGNVRKEPKLYLTVPVRRFFERKGFSVELGALREEFFVNHARHLGLCYPKGSGTGRKPDFVVNGKVFEVSGPGKGRGQRPDYVVSEGLLTGGNRVPLFLFGFLY